MSQDALSPKLQLPNIKPFKINDLAGGRGRAKWLILRSFLE